METERVGCYRLFLLRIALLLLIYLGNVNGCDTDNDWIAIDNKCYRYIQATVNWDSARSDCQQFNGDLIVINHIDIANKLRSTYINITASFWIGLRDQVGANNVANYRWINGETLANYSNWADGQPSTTGHNCVAANAQWQWSDTDCTNLLDYICQKNEATVNIVGGSITVAENQRSGTIAVELTEIVDFTNVTVSCNVLNRGPWIANFDFTPITIPTGSNSGNVPYRITSAGQAAAISCSAQSSEGTQFISARSSGRIGSVRVTKAAVVDFCSDVITVPFTRADSVRVELSEVVTTNPVTIDCSTVSSGTLVITVTSQDITVGNRIATMRYAADRTSGEASVICTAQSLNGGTQFLAATSSSRNATFRLQTVTLELTPRYGNMYQNSLTLYLAVSVAVPTTTSATFTCCIANYTDIESQSLFSCGSQITSSIVRSNDTYATISLQQTSYTMQSEENFKKVVLTASATTDRDWVSLLTVTCTSGASSSNVPSYTELNATAYINVNVPATVIENITTTTVSVFSSSSLCTCNLQYDFCDPNCCCDPDCTSTDRTTFTTCLTPYVVRPIEHDCSSKWPDLQDYEALMCVEIDNNPFLGHFYQAQSRITTVNAFNTAVANKTIYSYRETENVTVTEQIVRSINYKYGDVILLDNVDTPGNPVGYLALPYLMSGICNPGGLVRYLIDSQSQCTQVLSNRLCTSTSTWSATQYLMSRSIIYPPCPMPAAVIRAGSTVALTTANYYCVTDLSFFVTNTQSTSTSSQLTKCTFDDGRTQPPKPQFDSSSNVCSNVVLKVDYKLYWAGSEIDRVTADITLGNVLIDRSFRERNQKRLTQQFSVKYIYNNTVDSPITYSGNPGYIRNYAILFAINSATIGDANVVNSTGAFLRRWSPSSNGLCASAERIGVTFGDNMLSGCKLQLTLADFENCATLRERVKASLDGLISADYVGKRGNSTDSILTDWISIIKQSPNYTSIADDGNNENFMTSECKQIPSILVLTFLIAEVRTPPAGVLQWEIVGARISYELEDWKFICGTGSLYGCSARENQTTSPTVLPTNASSSIENATATTETVTDNSSTIATGVTQNSLIFSSPARTFTIKTEATFVIVPAIQETKERRSVELARERSRKCCSDFLYPFSQTNFSRLARDRAIAYAIMMILLLLGGIAITKPWV